MHPVLRHLRILWRLEAAIAQMRLRVAMRRCVLSAFAALIAALGLGMLNVAAFFALEPRWGAAWAALAAACGDLAIAAIIAAIALATRPTAELSSALELRQSAIESIENEFGPLQERFVWWSRAAHAPVDAVLAAFLVPLVTAIVRGIRRSRSNPDS